MRTRMASLSRAHFPGNLAKRAGALRPGPAICEPRATFATFLFDDDM
jgi:hypothetical protein